MSQTSDSASRPPDPIANLLRDLPRPDETDRAVAEARRLLAAPRRIVLFTKSLSDSYEREVARGVANGSKPLGYSLAIHAGVRYLARDAILERALWRRPDGVILATAALTGSTGFISVNDILWLKDRCAAAGLHPCFVSLGVFVPGVSSLVMDGAPMVAALVEHFVVHHRFERIAFVSGPFDNPEAAHRQSGYCQAVVRYGLQRLVFQGDFTTVSGEAAAVAILEQEQHVQAIICGNDAMAIGVLKVLRDRGRERDVLLSGYDDSVHAAVGQFTTVEANPEAQGYRAVRVLAARIEGLPEGPDAGILPAHIVVGRLCGCQHDIAPRDDAEDIVQRMRASMRLTEPIEGLVDAFEEAVAAANQRPSKYDPEPLLKYIATVAGAAHQEEVRRWRRLFSELRHWIERYVLDRERAYLYLRLVAEAADLLALAEQQAWVQEKERETRLGAVGTELQAASSSEGIWQIVRERFPSLFQSLLLLEDNSPGGQDAALRFGCRSGVLVPPLSRPVGPDDLPRRSIAYPLSLGIGRSGFVVVDLDSLCDWSSPEMLFDQLGAALTRASANERLDRLAEALVRAPPGGGVSELGSDLNDLVFLVAMLVKWSLGADIVVIYPLLHKTFPVAGRGPVYAGRIYEPERILTELGPDDPVTRLVQGGQTVLIDDTDADQVYSTWFRRPGRSGFQEREGVRSLSGHVLRDHTTQSIVGVMFCNYRSLTQVNATAARAERLAAIAAAAVQQGIEDLVAQASAMGGVTQPDC